MPRLLASVERKRHRELKVGSMSRTKMFKHPLASILPEITRILECRIRTPNKWRVLPLEDPNVFACTCRSCKRSCCVMTKAAPHIHIGKAGPFPMKAKAKRLTEHQSDSQKGGGENEAIWITLPPNLDECLNEYHKQHEYLFYISVKYRWPSATVHTTSSRLKGHGEPPHSTCMSHNFLKTK